MNLHNLKTKKAIRLYEIKSGKINVYSLTPKWKEIVLFRKKEMKSIPENQRVLEAITHEKELLGKSIMAETMFHDVRIEDIENPDVNAFDYHELVPTKLPLHDQKKLIEDFCNGFFNKIAITRVWKDLDDKDKNKIVQYLLCLESWYHHQDPDKKILPLIIQIPESLYLLQMLQSEKYDVINNQDLDKQLQLFDFDDNPTIQFNVKTVESLYKQNIVPGSMEWTLKKAADCEPIIQKVKTLN